MLVFLLFWLSFAAIGLLAALRPEVWCNCFLAEYQRRQLSGNFKIISVIGWVFFGAGLFVSACIAFPTFSSIAWPKLEFIFPAIAAALYIWWGWSLLLSPKQFSASAAAPFNRLPLPAIKSLGALLLVGAIGFLYLFGTQVSQALRH